MNSCGEAASDHDCIMSKTEGLNRGIEIEKGGGRSGGKGEEGAFTQRKIIYFIVILKSIGIDSKVAKR